MVLPSTCTHRSEKGEVLKKSSKRLRQKETHRTLWEEPAIIL